ncbi:golgin subfamily B member 1 isoform X2 [Malaya genurostris]|uniref:golgin subfamily B member 1 isoform X2 n=1 Tax=Malaya genurostris TaxID=325434 RepID=UPI0026F3DAF1|nr:golgin subfamily B member 1 isoform X2 [Malaya genurostris]
MNIGRLKLKAKSGSRNRNSNSPSLAEVTAEVSQASRLDSTDVKSGSRSEASVRFKLEDDIIGSLSGSSASFGSGSDTNNEDSLEIMEEIDIQDDGSKHEENTGSSISENIPLNVGAVDRVSSVFPESSGGQKLDDRRRHLFNIDDEPDLILGDSEDVGFNIDKLNLSGNDIAQHFQQFCEKDDSPDKNSNVERNQNEQSINIDSIEKQSQTKEQIASVRKQTLVQNLSSGMKKYEAKELSPLNEDDVLINSSKVNLGFLKKLHKQPHVQDNSSADNSSNTTNEISELVGDTESDRAMSDNYDQSSRSDSELKPKNSYKDAKKLVPISMRSKSDEIPDGNEERIAKPSFSSLRTVELGDYSLSDKPRGNSAEEDNSLDEIEISNPSIEAFAGIEGTESLKESEPHSFTVSMEPNEGQVSSASNDSDDLKEKIITSSKSFEEVQSQHELEVLNDKLEDEKTHSSVKKMEKVTDFKEALEDISEESEHTLTVSNHSGSRPNTDDELSAVEKGKEMRKILVEKILQRQLSIGSTILEDNKENIPDSLPFNKTSDSNSVVSLNMFQALEGEIKTMREIIATKDIYEVATSKDSWKEGTVDSLKDQQRSTDSISLATNSTEYRLVNDEYVPNKELHSTINKQNQWIEILAEKLQESIQARNQSETNLTKLTVEVNQLRKQLTDNTEVLKQRSNWMRDQESNGQRISEISIDLVSETDDALSDFPDLYEERSNRNSRERQLDLNLDIDYSEQNPLLIPTTMSKQFEQFRKYLSPDELRLFNMVQGKFDDYLKLELERQRNDLESHHEQEMTDQRTYFEQKCAEFEKQYSEEVISHHSRRLSNDTASDISDHEEFPAENGGYQSKQTSPKKKLKELIYLSPTHRKITPTTIDTTEGSADEVLEITTTEYEKEAQMDCDSAREIYQNKIVELNRKHSEEVHQLKERLKLYEDTDATKEFLPNTETPFTSKTASSLITQAMTTVASPDGLASSQSDVLLTTTASKINVASVGTEPNDDLHEIIADYERRLQEQVALARQDVLRELEIQIQALLSDTTIEDSHWPAELILLREKFTARSQLEIAQLRIKHEEEMARMKTEFEKQLQWKLKRQSTFDSARDLDKIIIERDNLRELSSTLRNVLGEFLKYVAVCEDDLNSTVIEELQRHGLILGAGDGEAAETSIVDMNLSNISVCSTTKKLLKFAPDVSGLISIIEDPSLLDYVSKDNGTSDDVNQSLNLEECLELLRSEALHLLTLSEKRTKRLATKDEDLDKISEKSDSCEEEDGLKRGLNKNASSRSFDDNLIRAVGLSESKFNAVSSLPLDLGSVQSSGELNIQLHELKNRLLKTEDEKRVLESRNNSLVVELNEAKLHLLELNSQRVEFSEGYGTNALLPSTHRSNNGFVELQERAKHLLGNTSPDNTIDISANLLQLVEDFCREGERYMEDEKRDKLDLQSQIEAADKQLKATRQFLEEQAAEREHERDEFVKEIEKLKSQLRDKDKDKVNVERVTKELEAAEQNGKELSVQLNERDDKIRKIENDLKDSIDKGFTLREIITELETQIESKSINEHVLHAKIKELELYIDAQNRQNESLHQEVESMKTDVTVRGFTEKIAKLEDELRHTRPSMEQSLVLEALTVQLRDIEETLERKTKNLESLHSNSAASLVCSSPSEDISVNQDSPLHRKKSSGGESTSQPPSLPVDEVQRIFDKLHRHTRIEDVAIKRINDLEMQVASVRNSYVELQHERDVLQERMSEQSLKITTLQSKLDEQRLRAEELHRQGASHLTVKVHDLQNELVNVKETLQTRDKQIANLKHFLENSQQVIERQEKELAMNQAENDRSQYELKLEAELQAKCDEIQILKSKIQNEMINKVALPDLMETMLADKNDEIDQLKEKLNHLQTSAVLPTTGHGKEDDNARTLSDIVSITDCDESDMVLRRMPEQTEGFLPANSIPVETSGSMFNSKQTPQSKNSTNNHSQDPIQKLPKPTIFPQSFEVPTFFQDLTTAFPRPTPSTGISSAGTPEFFPRHINFSLVDESRSTVGSARDRFREPAFIEEIREDEEIEETISVKLIPGENKPLHDDSAGNAETVKKEMESLKINLDRVTNEKNDTIEKIQAKLQEKIEEIADLQVELAARNKLYEDMLQEKKELKEELESVKTNLHELELIANKLELKENRLKETLETIVRQDAELAEVNLLYTQLREEMEQKANEFSLLKSEQHKNHTLLDTLKQQVESLNKTIGHKNELMSKMEKDIHNYSKNEEKYLEQLKSLDAKETELKILQGNYKDRLHEIEILNEDNRFLNEDINRLKNEIARSTSNSTSNPSYVQFLKQNCEKFEEELRETKVMLTEKMLALERVRIDLNSCQQEAQDLKALLRDKEMIIQQIGDDGNSLHEALTNIQNKMQENNSNLNKQLREEQDKNAILQTELNRLKIQLQRSDNSSSPKPFSVEEIAEQLEKELNYSAQLDSSIMKAIESDDLNSEEEANTRKGRKDNKSNHEVEELKAQLQLEADKCVKLNELLDSEKHNSSAIQMQDAEIIEAMRHRLEAAIENESMLQKLLTEEKNKTDRLSTLIAGVQRTRSFDNYLLMRVKSPHESPSRRLNRSNEFESDMVARFESEIKFLTAQNERERERAADLQRVLEREKSRFEKEISDRNEHGEQVKKELVRITSEKDRLEVELDHEQEKLMLAHKEIESLEKRIGAFQEAESVRSFRRERATGPSSLEFQELRQQLENLEQDRAQLRDTVQNLRSEVERRKQREAKLTEALSRENSLHEGGQASVPEDFLVKLRDMNRMLEINVRENHQQAETLRLLMDERKALQQRNQELERFSIHTNVNPYNRDDLEERANHLFGKYLRSESHRKALVHQKRYLQIVLTTYEENEVKALQLLSAQNIPPHIQDLAGLPTQESVHRHKLRSFRAVVTAIVAIERMKFIVRKWQGGRRICAKAIFSQQFTPRRSQSASTNVWARSSNSHFVEYNASPPARDRPGMLHPSVQHEPTYSGHYLRLPESQLLMNADMRERLEEQYNRSNSNR